MSFSRFEMLKSGLSSMTHLLREFDELFEVCYSSLETISDETDRETSHASGLAGWLEGSFSLKHF